MFLNYKFSSCRSFRKETEENNPPPQKNYDTHIWRNPNVSCNGRQDVKGHPNSHISTPIIIRKKYSSVNLYIQMHLRIYTYITLFNVIYINYPSPLAFNNFLCKAFIQTQKDVRLTWGKKMIITVDIQLKCSLSKSQDV